MIHFISNYSQEIEDEEILSSGFEDLEKWLSIRSGYGLDVETTGLDFLTHKITSIQVGNTKEQFVVDVRYSDPENVKRVFYKTLKDPTTLKILHNGIFDLNFLRSNYGFIVEKIWDTYVMEDMLHKGLEFVPRLSLDAVINRRLGILFGADKHGSRSKLLALRGAKMTPELIKYSAEDVSHLIPLYFAQKKVIENRDSQLQSNYKAVAKLENGMVPVLSEMEYNGIKMDLDKWRFLETEAVSELTLLASHLDKTVFTDPKFSKFVPKFIQGDLFLEKEELRRIKINWDSPQQVLKIFKTIKKDLENVEADTIRDIQLLHPILETYVLYKEVKKRISTYGERFLQNVRADGKIHTNFVQMVDTGRLASGSPNMQNIPANESVGNKYRNCFIPDEPGWVFVSADFSGQELALIAWDSQDPIFLDALSKGKDLHSVCAEVLYGQTWKDAADADCSYYKPAGDEQVVRLPDGDVLCVTEYAQQKCSCKGHKHLRNQVKALNFG